jgi:uncharacterized protein (TIGR03437 family)
MKGRRQFFQSLVRLGAAPALFSRPLRAAGLAQQPYLQSMTRESAVVVWATDIDGAGEVRFSEDPRLLRRSANVARELTPADTELNSSYFRHAVKLDGLKPDTDYYYRVFQDGQPFTAEGPKKFRTPGERPFTFLAFGDSGSGSVEQQTLAALMLKENAELVLHLGDIAYPHGAFTEYRAHYFDIYRDLMERVPFHPCPGNHGYMTREAFPYLTVHELPQLDIAPEFEKGRYYSYDWGNVHFVSLDSNTPLLRASRGNSPMLTWLDQDLAATDKFWKIVYFHHPPYAGGPNEADPLSVLAREWIVPIIERHNVQLVLNGHEHSYQRTVPIRDGQQVSASEGTVYITEGGGGAHLYEVRPHPLVEAAKSAHGYLRIEVTDARLRVRAIGLSGDVIDDVTLTPPPVAQSVVNSITGSPRLAAGALASVYGRQLAPYARAGSAPYSEKFGGLTAEVDGQPARLLYVSPRQVNVQLPYGVNAASKLTLKTTGGETAIDLALGEAAPGIIAVARDDGVAVSAEAPAPASALLTVYAAGLGDAETANKVRVFIDNTAVPVISVEPKTELPGVSKVHIAAPVKSARLQLSAAGVMSNAVMVPIAN